MIDDWGSFFAGIGVVLIASALWVIWFLYQEGKAEARGEWDGLEVDEHEEVV